MANKKCKNVTCGIQSGTTNVLYFTWVWNGYIPSTHKDWSKNKTTKDFKYQIQYTTGDGVWFWGENGSTVANNVRNLTYSIPSNAKKIRFRIKPESNTYKNNNVDTAWYTSEYTAWKEYKVVADKTPATPSTPTLSVSGNLLTMELDTYDENTKSVYFYVVKNDTKRYGEYSADVVKNHVSMTIAVDAGAEYKAKACGSNQKNDHMGSFETGEWSEYSSNVSPCPNTPSWISYYAKTSTEVKLDWTHSKGATSFEVQYTEYQRYFDSSGNVTSLTVNEESDYSHAEVSGLETGTKYFFRVRAKNDAGYSSWSEIVSVIVGEVPDAPTTWADAYTAEVTHSPILYWTHNSGDSSNETKAELYISINGVYIGALYDTEKKKQDQICSFPLNKLGKTFSSDTKIQFKIRTMGILQTKTNGNEAWSPWSTTRTIQLYQAPTIAADISGLDSSGNLYAYPLKVSYTAYPLSQLPISWSHELIACNSYETVDETGQDKNVVKGDVVWSMTYNATGKTTNVSVDPTVVSLENGEQYILKTTVGMNTGLTAIHEEKIKIVISEESMEIEAVVGYDSKSYTARIAVSVHDTSDDALLMNGVNVSIYRREFDGSFTPIATNISNKEGNTFVDPHPALDYARYRVVATVIESGSMDYYDVPAFPVQEKGIIIQWGEQWQNYEGSTENVVLAEKPWTGSLIRLAYNIDVSDDFAPDATLQKYIGRKRPVSYYGTQQGHTSNWRVDIPRDDEETLFAIRRLAAYMGDCYVREPSGTGYWAQINVSYSQTHAQLIIPITFTITRVEGGT